MTIFGEMSMIDDAPRSATVAATETAEIIVIQPSRLINPLASDDPIMSLLLRVLLNRFRQAQHELAGYAASQGAPDPALENIRRLAFDRINTVRDMQRALEAKEFEMHYQPIVALADGHLAGHRVQ